MLSAQDQRVNMFTVVGHTVPVTSARLCYCSEEAVTGNTERTNQALFQQNYFLEPGLRDGEIDLVLRIQTLCSWGMLTCLVIWVVCYYPEVAGKGPVAESSWNWPPIACHTVQNYGAPHTGVSGAGPGPDLACCSVDCGDSFYDLPDLYLQKCLSQDWCWGNEPMVPCLLLR